MNDRPDDDASRLERARATADGLIANTRSLMIASIAADGLPLVSYAPFARDADGGLLIAVSGLAAHGRVLAAAERVSIMLLEDEQAARQIFARTRLTFTCRVAPQIDADRAWVFARLRSRFGEIANLLEGLGDFSAYRLVPEHGNFVMGFGAAFELPDASLDSMRAVEIERG